ncbi:helix-turn-helix domain-containing protein [Carboxylicivirga sp. RSCT41]|uniref:helix-turn-helix domain-containing protein n=1 Tax=Carboxylicivirga agarovorans TaxID=3417570 RepID=UPI003D34BD01
MSYIYIVCLALIVFFSFSLITKSHKTLSEKIFTAWIFILAVTVLGFFLHSIGLFNRYLFLFSVICDTHVLHGAFFYLYARSFIDKDFRLKYIHLVNVIPFAALLGLKLYFNTVLGVMDCYGTGCIHEGNRYVDLLNFLKFFILGAYIFGGWYEVQSRKLSDNKLKGISELRATWISNITIGAFLLFSLSAVYKVLYRLDFGFLGDELTVVNLMVSFSIMIFLYMGNSYAYLFVAPVAGESLVLDADKSNVTMPVNKPKLKKPEHEDDIEVENLDEKFDLIERFIKAEKPYLLGQYTVRALSESVDIQQSEISVIIQKKTQKYYCDYMNDYRVEALKSKLDNPENDKYTIFSLAMDCGFASKTSYNRIFKNHTGLTPTEYREAQERK